MNENLKLFIESNKDKINIIRNENGEVTGIVSLVPSTELNFFKTNCKIDKVGFKHVLETIDGSKYDFSFKNLKLEAVGSIFGGTRKIKKTPKLSPKQITSNTIEYIKTLPKKIINKKSTEDISNIDKIKTDVDGLMNKLDKIFEVYKSNNTLNNSNELLQLKGKYDYLKIRYENVLKISDETKMLDVKNELVDLTNKLIAIEHGEKIEISTTVEKEPVELTVMEKRLIDDLKAEGITPDDPEFNQMINGRTVDRNKIISYLSTGNIEPVVPVKPEPVKIEEMVVSEPIEVINDTPKIEDIEVIKEEPKVEETKPTVETPQEEVKQESVVVKHQGDDERKKVILEGIEKSNKKVKEIEENITYYEKRLEETDNHIKNSNLDSYEISKFERVKKDYQEKLDNQKRMLEQAKEELKQNVAKLTAFMNEKVTYYVDGKPYKEVTRTELEKYKKMHVSDEKKKEDYKKQVELLKRRKELEEQLRENYEELKSLSTFSDDILYPKEEPSIEEIQETVRRFHQ